MEFFTSFDGTRIAYGLRGPTKSTRAVLLHHGFASTSHINWVRPGLVDALACTRRCVVTLDARGHGHSEAPHDPAAYAGGAMAKDVRALLDHLGLGEVDMAGYSMGAFVTLEVARVDTRLRSMFLGGAGASGAPARGSRLTAAIAEALEADDPRTISDRSARAFRNFADATGQDRLALAAIQRAGEALGPGAVSAIDLPALVVNGERDTLAGDPSALAALMKQATPLVVPGDHMSAVVKPEFRRALVEWATP
ncbi:MAG: alpha/beta fold hydrolase [Acidimicrobiales bacterium]